MIHFWYYKTDKKIKVYMKFNNFRSLIKYIFDNMKGFKKILLKISHFIFIFLLSVWPTLFVAFELVSNWVFY